MSSSGWRWASRVTETRTFGQLVITETDKGTSIGVPGEPMRVLESSPEELAEFVRTDDFGRYRPLSGANTLPTGWKVALSEQLPLDLALEIVYPLALAHQRQLAQGVLRVVPLEDVLARQSGRYEDVGNLSFDGRARVVETVCGSCVRCPVWDSAPCAPNDIPCAEPCSVFVAFCREAVLWEAEPPQSAPPDPAVPWAAFEEPGNELRERYLSEMIWTDEPKT